MAPSFAAVGVSPSYSSDEETKHFSLNQWKKKKEEEALRKRNEELEIELKKSQERMEKMREEMEKTQERLRIVEEAEESLCCQLGELEAEAVEQARSYQAQIRSLLQRLSQNHKLLQSANFLMPQRSVSE